MVITTGLSSIPHRPELPGQGDFGGEISHVCSYANPKPFLGRRVLVVGFGNSGAEIAWDLAEAGVSVAVVVRSACNVIPRKLMEIPLGIPRALFIALVRGLPTSWLDAYLRTAAKLTLGDVAKDRR